MRSLSGLIDGTSVVRVSAGFSHSAAITSDGRAWIWGKYMSPVVKKASKTHIFSDEVCVCTHARRDVLCLFFSTLGLVAIPLIRRSFPRGPPPRRLQHSPRQLSIPCRAVQVACGQFHTSILTEDGRLWILGVRPLDSHAGGGAADSVDAHPSADAAASAASSAAAAHLRRVVHEPVEVPVRGTALENARVAVLCAGHDALSAAVTEDGRAISWDWTNPPRVMPWTEPLPPVRGLAFSRYSALAIADPREAEGLS